MWRRMVFLAGLSALAVCLATALTASNPDVIYRGADLWQTPNDGSTFLQFSANPIPAGFFCSGSQPFSGRIQFRGEPLLTQPYGVLGNADTVVERLDDAAFNDEGVARTRVQIRALSLVSIDPIQTDCGMYRVTVGLEGEQPVTEMRIVRDGPIGGYFIVPIELTVRLSFLPVNAESDFDFAEPSRDSGERAYRPLQISQFFRLSSNPRAGWTSFPGQDGVRHESGFRVDLNGDGTAETELPGTSNFAVGWWDEGGVPTLTNIYLDSGDSGGLGKIAATLHAHHSITAPTRGKIIKK